ncbi:MAG: DUF3375 family protein [Desulfurivibrio sp.]|nr:DUF3375 family protein [Desulfurivibrio sp.]
MVDRIELSRHLRRTLQSREQVTLSELVATRPLSLGLAELLAYLQLAADWPGVEINEELLDPISWQTDTGHQRQAKLPRITFRRSRGADPPAVEPARPSHG